jgi:nitroreductase
MRTFKEFVLNRQSTRSFSDREVELEKLQRICEIASLSPSSCNSQPWKMHIVRPTYKKLDDLRKACQPVKMNPFLNNVRNFIVIEQTFGNMKSKSGGFFSNNDVNSIDLGILAAHLCLAAEDEGLGSCMIAAFRKKTVNKALGFSRLRRIRLVVAIGYPTENYGIRKKTRKSTNETIALID